MYLVSIRLRNARQCSKRGLPLQLWDRWSRPYIERIIQKTKKEHPTVPITVYANGSGGLLERLGSTGADVVGLDWTVDMSDARRRLGPDQSVQVSIYARLLRSDFDILVCFKQHRNLCLDCIVGTAMPGFLQVCICDGVPACTL